MKTLLVQIIRFSRENSEWDAKNYALSSYILLDLYVTVTFSYAKTVLFTRKYIYSHENIYVKTMSHAKTFMPFSRYNRTTRKLVDCIAWAWILDADNILNRKSQRILKVHVI